MIITLSHEFGSGGEEIAARVAERLGWPLVDRQLVRAVANRLGVSEAEVAARDQRVAGIAERVGRVVAAAFPEMLLPPPPLAELDYDTVRALIEATLREAARQPPLVVLGHGAQCVFSGRTDALHVRAWAPLEVRTARVADALALAESDARSRVLHEDERRREYLRRGYGIEVADPHHYSLVINTAQLSAEEAASAVIAVVHARGAQETSP